MSTYDGRYMDMHVHTAFSANDCTCPMEAYLSVLERGEVWGIGFADHLHPNAEQNALTYGTQVNFFDDAGYAAAIQAAKERGLNVHMGVELSYEKGYHGYSMECLARQEYEYVIGSAHSAGGFWVSRDYYRSLSQPGPMSEVIFHGYYDALLDVLAVDAFTAMAHIGIFKRDLPQDHPLLLANRDLIQDREQDLAKKCAQSPMLVELNTSSLTRAGKDNMPGVAFLKQYQALGGERICLASDAHDVANLNGHFTAAVELLRSLGFTHIFYPWDVAHPDPL